jgi:hypothetical protein
MKFFYPKAHPQQVATRSLLEDNTGLRQVSFFYLYVRYTLHSGKNARQSKETA